MRVYAYVTRTHTHARARERERERETRAFFTLTPLLYLVSFHPFHLCSYRVHPSSYSVFQNVCTLSHFSLISQLSLSLSLSLSRSNTRRLHPPHPRATPFFPRHFTPSSLRSLTVLRLPSLVVPHCPRSPPLSLPFLRSPLTPSDFLRGPPPPPVAPLFPPRPRRVPFAPSLIYCITVHEVANLRRVILYKYVSQINIRATTICMRGGCKASSVCLGIQRARSRDTTRIGQISRFLITWCAPVAAQPARVYIAGCLGNR